MFTKKNYQVKFQKQPNKRGYKTRAKNTSDILVYRLLGIQNRIRISSEPTTKTS
jgi:hypothetical protein